MAKPELFNKKSKLELEKQLQNESFERITCSFYRYVKIDSPKEMRDSLYLEWAELNILGRIYLAYEGVNAQISVPENEWDNFVSKLYNHTEFDKMSFKIAIEDEQESFLKLIIRIKPQIVADGLIDDEYDLSNNQYDWHTDGSNNHTFDVKFTVLINASTQPYKGGEFYLMGNGGEYHVKGLDKPGDVICIKSHIHHKVNPVTEGKRHTIAIHYSGPRFI